jgi:hypothetical protein
MPSQVNQSLGGLKKPRVSSEDLGAIQNRFLELYVHAKPFQEEAHINLNETFDRFHFIVGTFERAISILEKYSPSDFHSSHLYGYVIGALKKNSLYFEQVQNGNADGEEMAVAAEDGDDDDDDDDDGDDDDDNGNFFEGGSDFGGGGGGGSSGMNHDDDDDDDDDDNRGEMTVVVGSDDHQNDKFQQHYIRIFNLANKYNVH